MGFVRVVADGELHEMVSDEMNVVAEQPIALSIWVRYAGLTYTGTDPIAFGVTEYEFLANGSFAERASVDLATVSAPVGDSSNPANNDFIQLTANYTVPADGSVDQIRLRTKVASNLTAGTVDWSDGERIPNAHIRDSVVPGIGLTLDDITNKLYGFDESGWSHGDSANALGQQNDTVKGSAMAIASILAQLTPGAYAQDLFERAVSFTDLGSDWDTTYGAGTGNWGLDGHNAIWYSNTTRESLCRWVGATGTVSTTDYQTIVAVLATGPSQSATTAGYNDVIGRCDSTGQNYIRFRVGGNSAWSLSKFIAGVETVMDSGTLAKPPGSGSYIGLMCGDKVFTTPRSYTCWIGSVTVTSGTFSDTTSQFGAAYRGWGFGGRAERVDFAHSPYLPGELAQWTASDTT